MLFYLALIMRIGLLNRIFLMSVKIYLSIMTKTFAIEKRVYHKIDFTVVSTHGSMPIARELRKKGTDMIYFYS